MLVSGALSVAAGAACSAFGGAAFSTGAALSTAAGAAATRSLSFFAGDFFFDSGCFTSTLSQVVQLGASDVTATLHCDFFNARRVDQEDPLDADALEYAANGDGLTDSGAAALDDYAFITLGALFVAFNDFDEDLNGVANIHLGGVALDERRFNFLDNLVHDKKTLFLPADKAAEGIKYTTLRVDMKYYQLNPGEYRMFMFVEQLT